MFVCTWVCLHIKDSNLQLKKDFHKRFQQTEQMWCILLVQSIVVHMKTFPCSNLQKPFTSILSMTHHMQIPKMHVHFMSLSSYPLTWMYVQLYTLSRNTTFYPEGGVCSTWLLKHWTRTHPKSQQGVTLDFSWISAQKISQTFILSFVSSPSDGNIPYWRFCVCVLQVVGCGNEDWL